MSAEPEQTPAGDMDTRIDTDIQGLIELLADGENEDAVEAFWRAVQDSIQDQLGHRRYSLWFQQTELMRFEDGAFVVGVPNIIIQQHLAQKYTDSVECALEELLGEKASVKFDVAPRLFRQMNARREAEQTQSVEHLEQPARFGGAREETLVPRDWGFDNLIVTSSNRLPFAAAREVAGQENPRFRFVYVCGDYGLAKTALLRAIYALAAGPERGLEPELLSA
ncbi:MAG: DnaA N-terminal domain-containing protein, partial [Candidatus Brocadiia bacterium]